MQLFLPGRHGFPMDYRGIPNGFPEECRRILKGLRLPRHSDIETQLSDTCVVLRQLAPMGNIPPRAQMGPWAHGGPVYINIVLPGNQLLHQCYDYCCLRIYCPGSRFRTIEGTDPIIMQLSLIDRKTVPGQSRELTIQLCLLSVIVRKAVSGQLKELPDKHNPETNPPC